MSVANSDLPENVNHVLNSFLNAAKTCFGLDLDSIVLFGSAAEGRLRPVSDINLVLVLKQFSKAAVDNFRETYRMAHAAAKFEAMFLLKSEISTVANAFAVKFADIHARHRVLFGEDPFAALKISREAQIAQLKQLLTNLVLRLRERYVLISLREEQMALVLAEFAGPVRSAAAALLELEGRPASHPKEALQILIKDAHKPAWVDLLNAFSEARESMTLDPGKVENHIFELMDLATWLRTRVDSLKSA